MVVDHEWVAMLYAVPSDLAPKSVKTTIAGISWMWRSHYIWWAGARPDRTSASTTPKPWSTP
jgi:hypothetical protein